jgi:hypothetical protein
MMVALLLKNVDVQLWMNSEQLAWVEQGKRKNEAL